MAVLASLLALSPSLFAAFKVGDTVEVTGTYNVRSTPAGTALGTQSLGSQGVVTGGPTVASLSGTSYSWYDINFTTGVDGWVADTGLTLVLPPGFGTNFANGIDVYSGNGTITWTSVAGAKQSFTFVKASEGATYTDTKFAANMQTVRASGLLAGAYHFAHPLNNTGTNGAVLEAQHFLSVARAYVTNGWLPPALDVEDEPFGTDSTDPCSDGTDSAGTSLNLVCKLGQSALSAWVRAWVNEVKRQTGVTPVLYMNRTYAETGIEADLAACPLWVAYFRTPADLTPMTLGPWTNSWTFLQWAFTNTVSGVSGEIDSDIFAGDLRTLKLFAQQSVTTNVIPPIISGIGGGHVLPPTNGLFTFELSSAAQTSVIVQSSTNLAAWTNYLTIPISYGHGTFTETNLTSGQKFYRPHP